MGDGRRWWMWRWTMEEVHGFWWRAATETCRMVVSTCMHRLPWRLVFRGQMQGTSRTRYIHRQIARSCCFSSLELAHALFLIKNAQQHRGSPGATRLMMNVEPRFITPAQHNFIVCNPAPTIILEDFPHHNGLATSWGRGTRRQLPSERGYSSEWWLQRSLYASRPSRAGS